MSRNLTKKECLELDITTYNMAMELEWKRHKVKMNFSGDLSNCEYCNRKYRICCICDEASKRWDNMVQEVKEVSERRNNNEYNTDKSDKNNIISAIELYEENISDKVELIRILSSSMYTINDKWMINLNTKKVSRSYQDPW